MNDWMINNPEKQATLAFLLSAAANELFPERILSIEHSLSDGYYCHFEKKGKISSEDVGRLYEKIADYLQGEEKIRLEKLPKSQLTAHFISQKRKDKVAILNRWNVDLVPVVRFGKYFDYQIEPITTKKSVLQHFELRPYDVGFILRFLGDTFPERVETFRDAPKLYQIIKEHEAWGDILGVSNIGELNTLIESDEIVEMIWVAEGLHEKKISQIADQLCREFPEKRVVTIAGPSSSGKTTFSRRLGIQLKVNGFSTRPISMDDYYLDYNKIPADDSGKKDIEKISALDIKLLRDNVMFLLDGKDVPERKFNFKNRKGYFTGKTITIPDNTFLLFEGIHGLNPVFAKSLTQKSMQRIYISAITQLNVDNEHRVSTSDNRLLRRLVRDHQFRGYPAEVTLAQWDDVRKGEEENIFPFQEDADFMFNSSLVYEIPVLADKVIPLLNKVGKKNPNFPDAQRLLTFLSFFNTIPPEHIPETSILREFFGGSALMEDGR